jgi:PAS domain S-box-containing protein
MDELAAFGFDNAPIGLVVTRYRMILKCNQAFATMFGYQSKELEGKSLALLYPSTKEFVDVGELGLQNMKKTLRYHNNRIMKKRAGDQFWCRVQGISTTPEDPFARCVWSFADISYQRPVVALTRREREIAMFVVEGLPNKEIGQRLGISHRTVEAHRSRMMEKLGARNSNELFATLTGLPGW